MNAYDYLTDLQNAIDARLSGSPGEAQAQAWLLTQCRALGLEPELESFRYRTSQHLSGFKSLALALGIVALTLASLVANPWVVLIGLVVLPIGLSLTFRRLASASPEQDGANLLAGVNRSWPEIVAAPAAQIIFLSAHYDTAPSAPSWRLAIRRLQDAVAGLAFLGVFALVVVSLARGLMLLVGGFNDTAAAWAHGLTNFWLTVGAWTVLASGLPATLVVLLTTLTHQPEAQRPVNPGADDNGSGVAVVLSLLSTLVARQRPDCDVVAAFWGAEENGLQGSSAFVERHKDHLRPSETLVVNVDTVGRGRSLMAVAGEGVLSRRSVDEAVLQAWEQACRRVDALTIREWLTPLSGSSDHAAWLNAGFARTLSIGRGDLAPIPLPLRVLNLLLALPTGRHQTNVSHVHSPQDRLNQINPVYLAETQYVIEAFLTSEIGLL